mmetsp:Transcript_54527/g.126951  ORF Transcript_54527/g.126951 Transcript_54527/m.126951 type:complete len:228 (+) Transcript_54527:961-1644(+)
MAQLRWDPLGCCCHHGSSCHHAASCGSAAIPPNRQWDYCLGRPRRKSLPLSRPRPQECDQHSRPPPQPRCLEEPCVGSGLCSAADFPGCNARGSVCSATRAAATHRAALEFCPHERQPPRGASTCLCRSANWVDLGSLRAPPAAHAQGRGLFDASQGSQQSGLQRLPQGKAASFASPRIAPCQLTLCQRYELPSRRLPTHLRDAPPELQGVLPHDRECHGRQRPSVR